MQHENTRELIKALKDKSTNVLHFYVCSQVLRRENCYICEKVV